MTKQRRTPHGIVEEPDDTAIITAYMLGDAPPRRQAEIDNPFLRDLRLQAKAAWPERELQVMGIWFTRGLWGTRPWFYYLANRIFFPCFLAPDGRIHKMSQLRLLSEQKLLWAEELARVRHKEPLCDGAYIEEDVTIYGYKDGSIVPGWFTEANMRAASPNF